MLFGKTPLLCLSLAITLVACTGESDKGVQGPSAKRGRQIYLVNCVQCHNRNPSQAGSTGPAVKGSSLALLEAKILRQAYPQGYVPKRESKAMPAYPRLKKDLPHIAAFLQ